jgi:hypothetical protein
MTAVKSVSDGLRDCESETQLNLNLPFRISPGPRHLSRPLAAISNSDNRPAVSGANRAGNCSCSCCEGCGGRAVAARRARLSRDTVVGRPAPHARWSPVCHRPGPLGSQGQRKKRAHTHAFVMSVHLLHIAHCMCVPQCFPR